MYDAQIETQVRTRRFGRLNWQVSEIGYGMWGIAGGEGGWTGVTEDATRLDSLFRAVERGCNFFDTAWIYGRGGSEKLLGELLDQHRGDKLYVATKIPPKNRDFPSKRGDRIEDIFPAEFCDDYLKRSLDNLGTDCIDLMQFHVWEDHWADHDGWKRMIDDWKSEGLVRGVGLSINRWEPWNCLATLRTGLIDSVQVIYNIFDQAPEDELFPLCRDLDIAVIARVPFDEGTLTGTLTKDTTWPDGDWRNSYFVPENLCSSVDHAEALRAVLPDGMSMPEAALRFILQHPVLSTTIPGMRQLRHVDANLRVSGLPPLSPELMAELRRHRWDREPTEWSQ
ncbi:aldo/keto reductase [Thalassococcus sp. BH17M4-6]|uniref:aldo/keto reductase n=1 Tax=Thalassococcus sp. BH17M4-6 TaxID=3413148 RepID=UPI003BC70516